MNDIQKAMNELKPCPFCGGKAKLDTIGLMCQNYVVYCTKCHAEAGSIESTEKAIELWNRRAEPENKPLTLEQVTERRGKPLWYQPITDGKDTPFDINPAWFICNPDELPEPFYLYGKTWLAYDKESVSE